MNDANPDVWAIFYAYRDALPPFGRPVAYLTGDGLELSWTVRKGGGRPAWGHREWVDNQRLRTVGPDIIAAMAAVKATACFTRDHPDVHDVPAGYGDSAT